MVLTHKHARKHRDNNNIQILIETLYLATASRDDEAQTTTVDG